jgi:hypothetical protein
MPMNTGNEVPIREAMPSDATELARLRWDSRVEDQSAQLRAEFLRDCEAWLREALASRRWVAAIAESEPHSLCGCMFLQYVTNSGSRCEAKRMGLRHEPFCRFEATRAGHRPEIALLLDRDCAAPRAGVPDCLAERKVCGVVSTCGISSCVGSSRRIRRRTAA